MGYTQYSRSMTHDEALAECRRLNHWENEGERFDILADGITGSGEGRGYYAAIRHTDKASGASSTFCSVMIIHLSPFGYKEMTESAGPRIDRAPLGVLQALDPLPVRAPHSCSTCDGSGKLEGDKWAEHARGKACFSCDGTGKVDRWDHARRWRRDAWARYGGEPQGRQIELAI